MASPAGASSGNRCAASRTSRISEINCFLSFERRCRTLPALPRAEVAELVDALASGASGGNPVEVQILSSAPPDPDPPAIRDCARTARAPARGRRPAIRPGQARSYPATRGPRGGAPPAPDRLLPGSPPRRLAAFTGSLAGPSRLARPRFAQGRSMPRWTAGRAIRLSYQRFTFGKSARSTSCQTWRNTQGRVAKSAIERSPAR